MRALFTANPTFGPGALSEPETPPTNIVRASSEKRIRDKLKSELPLRPGVYGMLDKHGNWIYVGKSKALGRVCYYFFLLLLFFYYYFKSYLLVFGLYFLSLLSSTSLE